MAKRTQLGEARTIPEDENREITETTKTLLNAYRRMAPIGRIKVLDDVRRLAKGARQHG